MVSSWERLAGKLKEVEVRRDRRLRAATAVNLPTGEVTPWWEALEPEMKRTVARLLFSKVVVTPAQKLGGRPDWERIKVQWAA